MCVCVRVDCCGAQIQGEWRPAKRVWLFGVRTSDYDLPVGNFTSPLGVGMAYGCQGKQTPGGDPTVALDNDLGAGTQSPAP